MKRKYGAVYLMIPGVVYLIGITSAYAFTGEYISKYGDDMALFASFKSSDINYQSDDIDAGDIDRKIFSVGLSKAVNPKAKVFGGFNYVYDGELGGLDADLDAGYSIAVAGSYIFWTFYEYTAQGYGRFNYIFDETFKESRNDTDFSFGGYEFIFGIMGNWHIQPRIHVFVAFEMVPFSAFTMDVSSDVIREDWSIEREAMIGLKGGLIYDFSKWFLKGTVNVGSERAVGLSGGMKF
jgi:hypothetical protein